MTQHEIERLATTILHEAANEIPEDVDLRARLHARLAAAAQSATANTARGAQRAPGLRRAPTQTPAFAFGRYHAVTLLLVAAVLISGFAFARPLILEWFGDSALKGLSLQDATTINRSVTAHGITLTLEQGYADAARTALTMRIRMDSSTHMAGPDLGAMRLTDARGNLYKAITGAQIQGDGLFEFTPLRSDEMGTTQTMTLDVGAFFVEESGAPVSGPWSVTFQLRSRPAQSVAFTSLAQTHHGIEVAPLRLDRAPSGVRLLVRISGLAPDTSLFSLTHFVRRGDDIFGCPPGSNVCMGGSGGTSDGALLQLKTASGQALTPAWIGVAEAPATGGAASASPSSTDAVGTSGSAVLEFLFFTPLDSRAHAAYLTLNQIRVAAVGPTSTERSIDGPWTFTLPLA